MGSGTKFLVIDPDIVWLIIHNDLNNLDKLYDELYEDINELPCSKEFY